MLLPFFFFYLAWPLQTCSDRKSKTLTHRFGYNDMRGTIRGGHLHRVKDCWWWLSPLERKASQESIKSLVIAVMWLAAVSQYTVWDQQLGLLHKQLLSFDKSGDGEPCYSLSCSPRSEISPLKLLTIWTWIPFVVTFQSASISVAPYLET